MPRLIRVFAGRSHFVGFVVQRLISYFQVAWFILFHSFTEISQLMQTAKSLIRCCVLQCLIWVNSILFMERYAQEGSVGNTKGFNIYNCYGLSYTWAVTWQNQQSDCAPSEESDQPGHPPSLIRVFAVPMKKPWALSYPLSAQRRLWSDWADAQTDLSLRWAHTHFVGFVRLWLICFKILNAFCIA